LKKVHEPDDGISILEVPLSWWQRGSGCSSRSLNVSLPLREFSSQRWTLLYLNTYFIFLKIFFSIGYDLFFLWIPDWWAFPGKFTAPVYQDFSLYSRDFQPIRATLLFISVFSTINLLASSQSGIFYLFCTYSLLFHLTFTWFLPIGSFKSQSTSANNFQRIWINCILTVCRKFSERKSDSNRGRGWSRADKLAVNVISN
jgi:hypothetical protein